MHSPRPGVSVRAPNSHNSLIRYSLLGSAQRLEDLAIQQKPLLGGACLSGEATVWYARYNTGKTLFALHFIIEAVQAGRVTADDVMYINADDSSAGLAQKVRLMQDHGVHVLAPGWECFTADMFLTKVDEMIAANGADGKLIVIDTLKRFVDVMDKKASRAFTAVIRHFVMRGGTLLALAHTNKRLGPDGKPIPEGTADIINDFDCGYLLSHIGEVAGTGDRIVEFECVKSRGPALQRARYSYDAVSELDYVERLCSIQQLALDDPNGENSPPVNRVESEICAAIEASIKHGSGLKMDIVRTATMATRSSRRRVLAVLETYTGEDPKLHKWNFTVHDRGAKVYALLPRSAEPDAAA